MNDKKAVRGLCAVLGAAVLALFWGSAAHAGEPARTTEATGADVRAGEPGRVTEAAGAADEAGDESAKALEELRALLNVEPPPKTGEEAVAQLRELEPKIKEFADRNAKNEAGAQALGLLISIATDLNQATDLLNTFITRFPKHARTSEAKVLLARVKAESGDFAAARQILADHLKEYPDNPRKAAVQTMLASVQAKLDKLKAIGTEAKAFKTTDLAGKAVELKDYRDKIVLVDFFASWCEPCRAEMPNLIKLYDKYHDRGFEVLGISLDKKLNDAQEYVKDQGIKWTVTFEEPGEWLNPVVKLYGVDAIPATYLIGKDGKIIAIDVRGEELAAELAKLFPDEKKPEPANPEPPKTEPPKTAPEAPEQPKSGE